MTPCFEIAKFLNKADSLLAPLDRCNDHGRQKAKNVRANVWFGGATPLIIKQVFVGSCGNVLL